MIHTLLMSALLLKILNHESKIFEEYSTKRTLFLENLSQIKTNNLTQSQLLILINDIKGIIDPLKTSISAIDYYFTNTSLEKKDSIESSEKMLFYLLLGRFFETISESLESDPVLTEESSESLDSDSE